MKQRLFIFTLLGLSWLSAAGQVVIEGRVYDDKTSKPLAFAHIFIKGTEKGTISDTEGKFSLKVPALPVVLVVSEVAHQTRFVRVVSRNTNISLASVSLELEGVTVEERGDPYFKMANHVLDFEFYADLILLLGNSGREVRLINHRGDVVERRLTPGKFDEVYKDCLDNLHIVNEDTAYQIFYDYDDIRFIHPHPRAVFEKYLRNCECRYDKGLIYSVGRKRGLVTTFLYAAGGATMPFYELDDSSRTKYLETNYDLQYFIDQRNQGDMRYAMSVRQLKENLEDLQNNLELDWMDSKIIHPAAYYIFPSDDDLRVFSLGIMMEFRFTDLASSPQKNMITLEDEHLDYLTMDDTSRKIYAVYRNSRGQMWVADLDNPSSKMEIRQYAFPSDLKVYNGHLFFINDPAIDGSNYLFRKNQQMEAEEKTW